MTGHQDPASHDVQLWANPAEDVNEPGEHATGAELLLAHEAPAGHAVQFVAMPRLKWPVGQATAPLVDGQKYPAGHIVHDELLAKANVPEPGIHGIHVVDPPGA